MIAKRLLLRTACICLSLGGLWAAAFAQEDPAEVELIFPIVHSQFVGEPINLQTTLTFMNLSNSTVHATVTTYQDDGTPARILNICSLTGVPPDLTPEMSVEILAGQANDNLLTTTDIEGELPGFAGWGKLVLDHNAGVLGNSEILIRAIPEGCVQLSSGSSRSSDGQPSEEASSQLYLKAVQVPGVKPATHFWAFAKDRIDRQSAFSIVNPSATETAYVVLELLSGGEVATTTEISIPPLNRVARNVHEWFQESCPTCFRFGGPIRFTGSIPIAVGGIDVIKPDNLWTSLPVVSVDSLGGQ